MVPVAPGTFGSFFDGDCYIVLAVSEGWAGRGLSKEQRPPWCQGGNLSLGQWEELDWLHPKTVLTGCVQVPSSVAAL